MFVCLYIYFKNVHIYRVTTSSTNVLLFLIDIILNAVEKKYLIITLDLICKFFIIGKVGIQTYKLNFTLSMN